MQSQIEKQENFLKIHPDFSFLLIVPGILLASLILTMINLLSKDEAILLPIAVGAAEIFLILRTNVGDSLLAELVFLLTPILTGILAIAITHGICWGAPGFYSCSIERLYHLPLSDLFLVALPVIIYRIGYRLSGKRAASSVQTSKSL